MSENRRASLIRAYCDGELSPEAARAFESQMQDDPRLQAAVTFERQLRSRVAAALCINESEAPADLADRVREACRNAAGEAMAGAGADGPDRRSRSTQPPRRSLKDALAAIFAGPQQVSALAVFGVFALVTSVVLFGIFGTPIDDLSPSSNGDLGTEVALFVAGEHERCAMDGKVLETKVDVVSEADAALHISNHLDVARVVVFDLSEAGYRFIGEGRCAVPGAARSAHMIYRREVPGKPVAYTSIFLAPNLPTYDSFEAEQAAGGNGWSQISCKKQCSKDVFRTADRELVYFLVCCDPSDRDAIAKRISATLSRTSP